MLENLDTFLERTHEGRLDAQAQGREIREKTDS